MQTKSITLKEYCQLSGYSYESKGVNRRLKRGDLMPGMVAISKFGNAWNIEVLMTWYESKVKEVGNV